MTNFPVKVVGNKIAVKVQKEEKKQSLIIIPNETEKRSNIGEVVGVGQGRILQNGTTIPLPVHVGDRILFTQYAGFPISLGDDQEYTIISENDVIGILQGGEQ